MQPDSDPLREKPLAASPALRLPESLESVRLTIRAPRPGDGATVNAALREAWPDLLAWMDWAQEAREPPPVEQTERDLLAGRARFLAGEDFRLLLFLKGTDRFVGSSGLHDGDAAARTFEIGYWVAPRFAGQGYIGEAVEAIAAFAFRELRLAAVRISADARNRRACAVAERLGFRLAETPGERRVYERRNPAAMAGLAPRRAPRRTGDSAAADR